MPAAVRWGGWGRGCGTGLTDEGTPDLHRLVRRLRDAPGVSCCGGGVPEGLQRGGGARPMHLNKHGSHSLEITPHQTQANADCRFTNLGSFLQSLFVLLASELGSPQQRVHPARVQQVPDLLTSPERVPDYSSHLHSWSWALGMKTLELPRIKPSVDTDCTWQRLYCLMSYRLQGIPP